jgi:hypothetical protein
MGPEMPVGAKILEMTLCTNAMGGTVDVGDAVDADRYQAASADNAITRLDERAGFNYNIIATTTQVLVTLSAAVTAAGTIKVTCVYSAD